MADDPPPADAADLEAIRRLRARYFRFLDTQDWDALRSVFTDDAEIDVSADGAGHYHDRYRRVDGQWLIAAFRLSRLRREFTEPT